jgi:genome maintenance exonuclease 1
MFTPPPYNKQFQYCSVIEEKQDEETGAIYFADRDGTKVTKTHQDGKHAWLYPTGEIATDYMQRVTDSVSGKRYYATPTGNLTSVTTILSATGDKTFLEMWKKRVGEVEAERIRTEATRLGSLMHTHLENFIMSIERPTGSNVIRKMARDMSDVIIECGLKHLNEVWGMEEGLYFPSLYAGTADLIGVYRGKPAIIDYKSAKKIKKEEDIEDYFLQGSAYSLAHNELFGTDISTVVILMVDRDLKFKEFMVTGRTFNKYMDKWLHRFGTFHSDKAA